MKHLFFLILALSFTLNSARATEMTTRQSSTIERAIEAFPNLAKRLQINGLANGFSKIDSLGINQTKIQKNEQYPVSNPITQRKCGTWGGGDSYECEDIIVGYNTVMVDNYVTYCKIDCTAHLHSGATVKSTDFIPGSCE